MKCNFFIQISVCVSIKSYWTLFEWWLDHVIPFVVCSSADNYYCAWVLWCPTGSSVSGNRMLVLLRCIKTKIYQAAQLSYEIWNSANFCIQCLFHGVLLFVFQRFFIPMLCFLIFSFTIYTVNSFELYSTFYAFDILLVDHQRTE